MKTAHRLLASILCFAMSVLLASCVTYVPAPDLTQRMSITEARKALINGLKGSKVCNRGSCIWVSDWDSISGVRVTPTKLVVANASGRDREFQFNALKKITFSSGEGGTRLDGKMTFDRNVADALYVLQQNAINAPREADKYDVKFAASLADYRKKAAASAALPEEANKYRVQAEGAVRDKQFDDAADYYEMALKIAPWWPAGRFNRALVLGEIGDYEMAKREMKHYLQLVPDAPNARAAQEKIYDWERLESKVK